MIRKFFTILFVALLATMQAGAATYYSASFETTGSGHVSLNKLTTIQAGETLRLFLRPSENWELQSVKVVLASDETTEMELNDYADPNYIAYSFVAPAGDIIVRTVFVHTWFDVTIDQPEVGGAVAVDKVKVRQGETVAITANPDIEHYTSWVQVTRDDNSEIVSTSRDDLNAFSFTMPASDVLITAGFTAKEKYSITNDGGEHGSVQVKSTGVADEIIIVSVTPDRGYELDRVVAYKTEAIAGGFHYEPLDVTPIDDTHSSFVMPAARANAGAMFKKKIYPVNIKEGADQANFSLFNNVTGFTGDEYAIMYVYPHDNSLTIANIVLTDEDDNELEYSLEHHTLGGEYYYVGFTMPYSPVDVRVRFKAPTNVPVVLTYDENLGTIDIDKDTAHPGDTVNITVTPAADYVLRSLTAVAGYEVTGGGGGAHAPRRDGSLWYEQQQLEVAQVDDTHYQIILPEQLASELTPNYLDDTQIRVEADFHLVGPLAIYCDDAATLYFVHDTPPVDYQVGDQYEGRTITGIWNGATVTATGWGIPAWSSIDSRVTTVVFTPSFADVRPTSCYAWFANFSSLTAIEGIENLNTSEVTNMNSMFLNCSSLSTIDVSGFDVSRVGNTTSMFRACRILTTIYCNDTWDISTAQFTFLGSTQLLGAVSYHGNMIDGYMSNPVTGYFTGKWAITIPEVDGGTVACEQTEAYTNEVVSIVVTPDQGHQVQSIAITTIDGSTPAGAPRAAPRRASIDFTDQGNGTYTFKMPPAAVKVEVTFKQDIVTAVGDINAPQPASGNRYNLQGQPVDQNYRGIVIENGTKKVIR